MRHRNALAVILLLTSGRMAAQSSPAVVQTVGGLHTAVLQTTQGTVRVSIASDAAPGDTISGIVRAEPAGRSPQEREQNLGALNGLVVEWQGQRTAVSERQYTWTIPAALRTGRAMLTLHTRDGRILSQGTVPLDGVPAPALAQPSGRDAFELPADVQAGLPGVIRGPFGGTFAGTAVLVGDAEGELLAVSPRRLVFRVPLNHVGQVPLRLTSNGGSVTGTVRVLSVRLISTSTPLARDQKATVTVVISGLQKLATPVTVMLWNLSTDVVRLQDGDVQTVAITPSQVQPDGTVTLTRAVTGVRPAAFQIATMVSGRPLTQFDVSRAADRVLTTWQAATGIRITPDARDLIQRSVLDASGPLEQFLALQQANRADVRDVFAALLSNYCFDLRDEKPGATPLAMRNATPFGLGRATFQQTPRPTGGTEIDASDVRRLSFRESLTRLVERFSASQPVGYLLVQSVPVSASITIDGQRKSEMTNRRFVTSIGEHAVVITGPTRTCRHQVQVTAFQISVVACEP